MYVCLLGIVFIFIHEVNLHRMSASSASTRRKWSMVEDSIFISCMLELQSTGRFNADSGFRSGYMNELERMLEQKLPGCGLKPRPHIDSRLRSLKREWRVVYDMKNASGFGWDDVRKMATAESDVWAAYLKVSVYLSKRPSLVKQSMSS